MHKTANVLNTLPKGMQKRAKAHPHQIWMAASRVEAEAERSFDFSLDAYRAKYPKAARCLARGRDDPLSFHDVPAEHWKHIRAGNPYYCRPAAPGPKPDFLEVHRA